MKVKLSDKPTTYAPKALQARFLPGCQWLGTVVVDDGRRGALMLTPDGMYFMVRSFNQTHRLNTEQAALAVAEAMEKPARVPKPPGRPAIHGSPMVLFGAKMPKYILDAAKLEGKGNLSLGLRRFINEGMEAMGYAIPD